jgi:multimeric flavodoxin WrbA
VRILGIVGSPRKNGNTEIMVRDALKYAEDSGAETDIFLIAENTVAPCDGCEACTKTGVCHIKDDMQELYEKMKWADGILFGTPVYYGGVTAQAKAIIDRTHCFRKHRVLKDKVAGAIIVTRRLGATQVRGMLYSYFIGHGAIAVGAAVGIAREKGEILKGVGGSPEDLPALEEGRNLTKRLMEMVERLPRP